MTEAQDRSLKPNKEDLTDVSERHLTRTHRLQDVLFHGMPEVCERFYLDLERGQERLLSREYLRPGSDGFLDVKEAAKDYVGIFTEAANFEAKNLKKEVNSLQQGDVLVHTAHSRSNLIYQSTVKQLSYDERQKIHFRGYGSPKIEELSDHASMHYHSCESDAVTWLDGLRFLTKEGKEVVGEMQAQNGYVTRHPLIKSDHPRGAHGFLAPTYQKALEDDMEALFRLLRIMEVDR